MPDGKIGFTLVVRLDVQAMSGSFFVAHGKVRKDILIDEYNAKVWVTLGVPHLFKAVTLQFTEGG